MANERRVFLTTEDNPYDPENEFEEWYDYDLRAGYDTLGLIARYAWTSNDLPDEDNEAERENAIDTIIKWNFTGNYKKIVRED